MSSAFGTDPVVTSVAKTAYVSVMVTEIHKFRAKPLFLREHREAKHVSAQIMAGRLGIERESVYRLERHQGRLNPEKLAEYAAALGIEPEDLWRPPGKPSLDSLVKNQPETMVEMVTDVVRRMVGKG